MTTKDMERRTFSVREFRVEGADGLPPKISGHAAVFDQLSEDLGGFRERIAKGAFERTLKEGADVRGLFNHDPNFILGRSTAGTLRLKEDISGLLTEIDPPDTQFARDLLVSMKRGDISQMSFGFYTKQDKWDKLDGAWVRTLLDAELFDVSIVTYPAYPQTDAAVRSLAAARQTIELPPETPYLIGLRRRELELIA